MNFLLRNATLINLGAPVDVTADLAVRDGLLLPASELGSEEFQELEGCVVTHGFMDMHVHLRDPGQTYKEDMESAARAAHRGGFSDVLAMPNTVPPIDTPSRYLELMERAASIRQVRIHQSAAMTEGRQGRRMTDMEALAAVGVLAFSDDGSTPQDPHLMRDIMQAAAELQRPIIDHCENLSLSKPGVMHDGAVARELNLPGQPRLAEESIAARDIELAQDTGCRIHLQHISSAGTVKLLREAKRHGLSVSAEVCPHHLFMTDEWCKTHGTNAKMAPPLREESDRQALLEALCDGTVEAIATDHAPHAAAEKARGWMEAPFGIVGLEAAVPLCLDGLVNSGRMSLRQLIDRFAAGPRRLLNLPLEPVVIGSPINRLTLLLPEAPHVIRVANFASKGRNCPYDGWKCLGHPFFIESTENPE